MTSNLILVEGISGSGKGERLKTLADYVRKHFDVSVTEFREPHHLRDEIFAYKKRPDRDPAEELRLFTEDRRLGLQDYVHLIGKQGQLLMADRSFLSSYVYQSLQGVPLDEIKQANAFYPTPDLAFILLCDPQTALERVHGRQESQNVAVTQDENLRKITALRQRYIDVCSALPYARFINTNGRPEAIDLVLRSHINNYLGKPMNKAVFLDKDGTIADNAGYPEVIPADTLYPPSFDALRDMQTKGYKLFIISSQPWVVRGRMTPEQVEDVFISVVTQYAARGVTIDGYGYCAHDRKDDCPDKKPGTRLFEQFIEQHDIDTTRSYMIGDQDTDITAGKNIGLTTIRIKNAFPDTAAPDHVVEDIAEAATRVSPR